MKRGKLVIGAALAFASATAGVGAEAILADSSQAVVVRTRDWHDSRGTLALYERSTRQQAATWRRVSPEVPVMLGRNGLAWGIGRHPQRPTKHEGDGRSPAGVFELERTYGSSATPPTAHFPYEELSATMEGIDDPDSRYYNRLVDARRVRVRDWKQSERVDPDNPMFRWCVEVKQNWQQRPGFGSCIYLHIWKGPGVPTSGCTAMSERDLRRIVAWLDARKRPLLVQLPASELERAKFER